MLNRETPSEEVDLHLSQELYEKLFHEAFVNNDLVGLKELLTKYDCGKLIKDKASELG